MKAREQALKAARERQAQSDNWEAMERKKRRAEANKKARAEKVKKMRAGAGQAAELAKQKAAENRAKMLSAMGDGQRRALEALERKRAEWRKLRTKLRDMPWRDILSHILPDVVRDDMLSMSAAQLLAEKKRLAQLQEMLQHDPQSVLQELGEDLGSHDFATFAQLRQQYEEEGRWKYESASAAARRVRSEEAEREERRLREKEKKNRFMAKRLLKEGRVEDAKKAEAELEALKKQRRASTMPGKAHDAQNAIKADKARKCTWSDRNDDGVNFHCTNDRMVHPITGQTLKHCPYHVPHCVDDHGGINVKVTIPNALGRCNKHFMNIEKKQPKEFDKFRVPGVHRVNMKALQMRMALDTESTAVDGSKDELSTQSRCQWRWTRPSDKSRWHCTNTVMRHPSTGKLLKTCFYHTPNCVMPHPTEVGNTVPIKIPNECALCATHYLGMHGKKVQWPAKPEGAVDVGKEQKLYIPGVQRTQKKTDEVLAAEKRARLKPHPLRPRQAVSSSSEDDDDDDGDGGKVLGRDNAAGGQVAVRKGGEGLLSSDEAAKRKREEAEFSSDYSGTGSSSSSSEDEDEVFEIPGEPEEWNLYRRWKGHQLKVRRKWYWLAFWFLRRYFPIYKQRCARRVQRLYRAHFVRTHLGKKKMFDGYLKRKVAVRVVQRVVRGFLGRCEAYREYKRQFGASIVLQSVCRMHIIRTRFKRHNAALIIQRNVRGFMAVQRTGAMRCLADVVGANEDASWASTCIQRFWRGYLGREKYRRMKARRKIEDRAAIHIQRIVRGYIARLIFAMMYEEEMRRRRAIHCIQRAIRGHLARRAFRRMYIRVTHAAGIITRRWRGVQHRREAEKQREAIRFWFRFVNRAEAALAPRGDIGASKYEKQLPRHFYDPEFGKQAPFELLPVPSWKYDNSMWSSDMERGIAGLGSQHLGMEFDPAKVHSNAHSTTLVLPTKEAEKRRQRRAERKAERERSQLLDDASIGASALSIPGEAAPLRLRGGATAPDSGLQQPSIASSSSLTFSEATVSAPVSITELVPQRLQGIVLKFNIRKVDPPAEEDEDKAAHARLFGAAGQRSKPEEHVAPPSARITMSLVPVPRGTANESGDAEHEIVVVDLPAFRNGVASPAEQAGLQVGDVLLSVGGRDVRGRQLWEVHETFDATLRSVEVRVLRRDGGVGYRLDGNTGELNIVTAKTGRGRLARVDEPGTEFAQMSHVRAASLNMMHEMKEAGLEVQTKYDEGELVKKAGPVKLIDEAGETRFELAKVGDRIITDAETGAQTLVPVAEQKTEIEMLQDSRLNTQHIMIDGEKYNWNHEEEQDHMEGAEYFKEFDTCNSGQVSIREFKVALAKLWPGPLLEHEANQLAFLFDEARNGFVQWRKFLAYAHRQFYPCTKHRRAACALCHVYAHRQGIYFPRPRRDKDYVRGEVVSRKQMGEIFARKADFQGQVVPVPPDHHLEVGVEQRARAGTGGAGSRANTAYASGAGGNVDGGFDKQYGKGPPGIQHTMAEVKFLSTSKNNGTDSFIGIAEQTFDAIKAEAEWVPPSREWVSRPMMTAVGDPSELADAALDGTVPPSTTLVHRGNTPRSIFTAPLPAPGLSDDALGQGIASNGAARRELATTAQGARRAMKLEPVRPAPAVLNEFKLFSGKSHFDEQDAALKESLRVNKEVHGVMTRQIDNRFTSKKERTMGFGITEPVPMIVKGEYKMTADTGMLYVDMLLALSDRNQRLIEDEHAFLQFCFNSFVFMERHWRKLVEDMRDGTINERVPLEPEARRRIEATLLPQPRRARKLDDALRNLGFHFRLSTEDASQQAMDGEASTQQQGTNEMLMNATAIAAKGRPSSAGQKKKVGAAAALLDEAQSTAAKVIGERNAAAAASTLPETLMIAERRPGVGEKPGAANTSTLSAVDGRRRPRLTARKTVANLTHNGKGMSTVSASASVKQLPSPRSALQQALEAPKTKADERREESDGLRVSKQLRERPQSAEQRISASAPWRSLKPLEKQKILQDSAADLAVLPRRQPDDAVHTDTRNIRQWICPQPGCGKVFSSQRGVQWHIEKEHTNRRRLGVAVPLTDQHMHTYWPPGVPWMQCKEISTDATSSNAKDQGKLVKLDFSSNPILCPVPTCGKRFADESGLRTHLRRQHKPSEIPGDAGADPVGGSRNAVKFVGNYVLVPPYFPPHRAETVVCRVHEAPRAGCSACMHPMLTGGPCPPLKYYEEVSFNGTRFKVGAEQALKPYFIGAEYPNVKVIMPCSVHGICVDRKGQQWMAVSEFWRPKHCEMVGVQLVRPDIDGEHELLESSAVTYKPLDSIEGACHVLFISRREFLDFKKARTLPKGVVYFARDAFSLSTREVLGLREIPKLTKEQKRRQSLTGTLAFE